MRLGWQLLRKEDKQALFNAIRTGAEPCPGPFHLEVDPFDACNARCDFCISKNIPQKQTLPWDRLRGLLDDARHGGLRAIRLSGGGEPTLYPHFLDLLEWLTAADVRLENLTTNGLKLSGALAQGLALNPPSFLIVSLNYATAESYARGMGLTPAHFEQVCENIRQFSALAREAGRAADCQIHVQFMLGGDTLDDLPEMFDLARRLGVYGLTLRGIYNLPPQKRLSPQERRRFLETAAPLAHRHTDCYWIMFDLGCEGLDAETAALSAAIHAHHAQGPAPDPELDAFRFCLMPWYSMAVLGTGLVHPCCMLLPDASVWPVGNLMTHSLHEIWNGPGFRQLRREIRRAMVLGGPAPLSRLLCRHSAWPCWSPNGCSIAARQLDPEDWRELAAIITGLRSSWNGKVTNFNFNVLRKAVKLIK